MRHLKVTDSDNIELIGFHCATDAACGTLEVVFKSSPSDVYRYDRVPVSSFVKLTSADSIGKEFHELFRKTKYPFTKSTRSEVTLKK